MDFKAIKAKFINILTNLKDLSSIKNIFWNFSSGVWLAVLIVFSTPWYVSKLGLELYGLLGIWLVLQAMMNIFDFGLGTTIIKEFSSAKSDLEGARHKRDLLKTIEIFYWIISGLILLILIISSLFLRRDWFNFKSNESINVVNILFLMSFTLFLQYPNVLYLNGLIGLQKHRLMNTLLIIGNSLRYGLGSLILIWHADLIWFFSVQIFVAGSQTLLSRFILWRHISNKDLMNPKFNFELIKNSARFSIGMALTSVAAVTVANIDRIVISKMLPASDLGRYAIAFYSNRSFYN